MWYTPFKKVTQHNFDRLYFFHPGFVFIIRYPWKACLFAFRLMHLFVRIVSLGRVYQCISGPISVILIKYHCSSLGSFIIKVGGNVKKEKLQKWSYCMGNSCYVKPCASLLWAYAHAPTAHSLIVPKSCETIHHAEFQIVVLFFLHCV